MWKSRLRRPRLLRRSLPLRKKFWQSLATLSSFIPPERKRRGYPRQSNMGHSGERQRILVPYPL